LRDSLRDEEEEKRKRRGRKKDWKSGPSFFEEEGELGNDIKKAVNRIEYSRVENDINKQQRLNKFISTPPPIIKHQYHHFLFFSLSFSPLLQRWRGGDDGEWVPAPTPIGGGLRGK
jgi:hypothetical protein